MTDLSGRLLAWAIGMGLVLLATASVRAEQAKPDPAGNSMTLPSAASVPNYVAPDPEKATAKDLATAIDAVARSTSRNFHAVNSAWVLVAGFLVMFMQAGFALVGTGLGRAKNAAQTMSMSFMAYALGITGFFLCGFALMCGGASGTFIGGPASLGGMPTLDSMVKIGEWGILGKTGFLLTGRAYDAQVIVWFLFMMVFVNIAATIPTGALAERWSFKSFFVFSLLLGAVVYPIYGCWVWGGGWLAQLGGLAGIGHGVVDYAGSSVVHLQAGAVALITALLLGPRIGKYDENGRPRPILGHHAPMVFLGTFVLAFGWFGLNAGSSLAATDGRIGIIAANTMLASASSTLVSAIYMWWRFGKPDPSMMCNGMLAGLVAITAPCAFVAPWAAFLIGAIAGLLVVWSVFFWEKLGIDDPVGAISVHGVNGVWGMLAVGLFADGTYGAGWNGVDGAIKGLFYGDRMQLLAQVMGVVVCATWSIVAAGTLFWAIGKILGTNRVPAEVEIAGLDIPEMGAPGYPEFISSITPETISATEVENAKSQIPHLMRVM